MAAVRGGDQVLPREVDADTGCDRLLPGGQVQRPAHARVAAKHPAEGRNASLGGRFCRVLERADARHRAEKR